MGSDIPEVSVLMPVYNGGTYLSVAIESILVQSFQDFELIVIDDGSTDNSWSVITSFEDERIVASRNPTNLGLSRTLNLCAQRARGNFLARHDQDDISHVDRFQHQVRHLHDHSNLVAVGTWATFRVLTPFGHIDRSPRQQHPVSDPDIRLLLSWNNPFIHGSVMMRHSAFKECGGYSEDVSLTPPEDYELWTRLGELGAFANIPKQLLIYQINPDGMSKTRSEEIFSKLRTISTLYVQRSTTRLITQSAATSIAILNGRSHPEMGFRDFLNAHHLVLVLARAVRLHCGVWPSNQMRRALVTICLTHLRTMMRKQRAFEWLIRLTRRLRKRE
jgi:glycosyltransferase involved in cell wall biosynthesis